VPRQRRPSQYQSWGPKLLQLQNLGGCFVVFFLGNQNRNFGKVRGLKLQLSLILNWSQLLFNLKYLPKTTQYYILTKFISPIYFLSTVHKSFTLFISFSPNKMKS